MKKLVTAFALCAAATMTAMAVDSENVVGYTTKSTVANTQDMMGIGFQNPGTNTLSIQSIVPVSGFSMFGGDLLRIWNPLTKKYKDFYYFGETYAVEDVDQLTNLGQGWADGLQFRSTVTLDPGQGFWLKTESVASFTVSGEVLKPIDNQISTLANTQDMVTGVFPVTMSIQAAVPVSGFSMFGGDLLRIWNPLTKKYKDFYYFGETYAVEDVDQLTNLGQGWADGLQFRATATIDQGQGFWLKTESAAVLSFTSPY